MLLLYEFIFTNIINCDQVFIILSFFWAAKKQELIFSHSKLNSDIFTTYF